LVGLIPPLDEHGYLPPGVHRATLGGGDRAARAGQRAAEYDFFANAFFASDRNMVANGGRRGRAMNLENDQQVANTQYKLGLLEEQIKKAEARPSSPENDESIRAVVQMANQLKEEIIRYRSRQQRRAS
jgi:hypothetical protein